MIQIEKLGESEKDEDFKMVYFSTMCDFEDGTVARGLGVY